MITLIITPHLNCIAALDSKTQLLKLMRCILDFFILVVACTGVARVWKAHQVSGQTGVYPATSEWLYKTFGGPLKNANFYPPAIYRVDVYSIAVLIV